MLPIKPELVDDLTGSQDTPPASDPLARVLADLDRKLAWLSEPGAGAELKRIFNSTPEEIAEAANALAARQSLAKRES